MQQSCKGDQCSSFWLSNESLLPGFTQRLRVQVKAEKALKLTYQKLITW